MFDGSLNLVYHVYDGDFYNNINVLKIDTFSQYLIDVIYIYFWAHKINI